ncbi:DEAD/DEAH box helicase [Catenovulum sp. SM1970]|uniref:DEAD/DEAH box helicase n=1 Tax=Marinifaba aquimaris TaxID=2741323 RepID=UPI001573B177|nr:DEAD/DEAH box helicase [Marinifaba aquimaris]NTS78781.1 DEAD/DEAH box helicase [Marinifaba aquimaris]
MTDSANTVRFSELNLPAPVLQAITEMGYEQPTPIQAKSIPSLLEGRDVLGEAQTGTGKTAAFGLPLLSRIDASIKAPQMLVVCPTRELAIQVSEALADFAKHIKGLFVATVYGGQSYTPQLRDLKRGPQIVVGTPGRMMDHINKGRLKMDSIKACVLDEADEMLNMGFLDDIEWILEHLPEETQMAFFSATMPAPIRKITKQFLTDPVHVQIPVEKAKKANITQKAWRVSRIGKTTGLERIAEAVDYDAMIVFVRTRNDTLILAEHLVSKGFKAAALNGDMQQQDRERIVDQLKSGRISILIATDVVARGLDVPRISHVINYDLPHDAESYVHRIGRTGRAGREGEAILFATGREMRSLFRLERATEGKIEKFEMPSAEQLGASRIERTKESLVELINDKDLAQFQQVIEKMAEESEVSALQLATALLFERQRKLPLFPKADPVERPERERRERGDRNSRDRGERSERRPRRNNDDFDTYRFAVGREHGVRPGDIVGAVANEIEIDSSNIGQINLFDQHAHVDLPKGMPKDVFNKLQQVFIRKKNIDPSLLTPEQAAEARAQNQERRARRDANRGDDRNFRGNRRDGGRGHDRGHRGDRSDRGNRHHRDGNRDGGRDGGKVSFRAGGERNDRNGRSRPQF